MSEYHTITRTRLLTLVLILTLLAPLLPSTRAFAQDSPGERVAVIQILDDSGSMESNDPTDLRYTAAQLFASLLDEGDALGALRFSTKSSQITNGIEVIGSPEQHIRLVQSLAAAPADGFTDVKAAFEEARRMQAAFSQAGYRVVVIFLTDGKPEIPVPYETYEQEALDAARDLGIPILSVALTHAGQSSFLNRLASETGGKVIFAKSAADLLDIYLQILGDLKDRTVISAGDASGNTRAPGNAVLSIDPALAPYVDRMSFIISKPEVAGASLVTPDGRVVSGSDTEATFAIEDRRFAVYSLSAPPAGDWNVELTGSGNTQVRGILYSRLRVRLVSPQGSFEAGQPLPLVISLVEEQPDQPPVTIIGEASFAAWITRPDGTQDSLDQFYDDGSNGDAIAGDGLYTRLYVNTKQEGNYHLEIRGRKGAIPVAYQTQMQSVVFPRPGLVQPAQVQYDIRTNTVPLQIQLSGAEVDELDRGGFEAWITPPDGTPVQVPLEASEGGYAGEYLPTQEGSHHVRFEPVEATYQGLPYTHYLETTFESRLIPTISVQTVQVGLQPQTDEAISRFELAEAQQGIPLVVTFSSSSTRPEAVSAHLEDLPGFTLIDAENLQIAPGRRTTHNMHLLVDPAVKAQTVRGRLQFTAQDGIDLTGGDSPLVFDLFEPFLSVTPVITSTVSSESCLRWAPIRLVLLVRSTSREEERIQIRLNELKNVGVSGANTDLVSGGAANLSQETVIVPPGESQVEITILPGNGKAGNSSLSPGSYAGRITIEGQRPGLKMDGESSLPISFTVEPFWITCQKPLMISGSALFFGVVVLVAVIARGRRKSRPPIVSGTLIHWDSAAPDLTTSVNLTAIGKTEVRIGKDDHNEVVIHDESIEPEHVTITAERGEEDELRLSLQLKGSLRKGYREYLPNSAGDLPLEENVQYQMGKRAFKYIKDIDF